MKLHKNCSSLVFIYFVFHQVFLLIVSIVISRIICLNSRAFSLSIKSIQRFKKLRKSNIHKLDFALFKPKSSSNRPTSMSLLNALFASLSLFPVKISYQFFLNSFSFASKYLSIVLWSTSKNSVTCFLVNQSFHSK